MVCHLVHSGRGRCGTMFHWQSLHWLWWQPTQFPKISKGSQGATTRRRSIVGRVSRDSDCWVSGHGELQWTLLTGWFLSQADATSNCLLPCKSGLSWPHSHHKKLQHLRCVLGILSKVNFKNIIQFLVVSDFIQWAMPLNFCTQWANTLMHTIVIFTLSNLRLNFAFLTFSESFKYGQHAKKRGATNFKVYNFTIEEPWTIENLWVVINSSCLKYPTVGLVKKFIDQKIFVFL
jgi:hypothetical protein